MNVTFMKKLFGLKNRILLLSSACISMLVGLTYAEDVDKAFPPIFDLVNLNGTDGFAINGYMPSGSSGISVDEAGDVNGDGIDDFIIGAPGANNHTGQSYVIFGSKKLWPGSINLNYLNGKNGFTINGINMEDSSGYFVSGAGDVNGDGIADILIGAPTANNNTGQSYLVFGSKKSWPATINLAALNGNNGFIMNGINLQDLCGWSVSRAGDVNGDGIDDILIGAPQGNNNTGQSYVVFGSKNQWPTTISLADLNGSNGYAINGIHAGDFSGGSVSGAGDINGDGIDDILINSSTANIAGQSYVVFGSKAAWPSASFNLSNLNGNNGFAINSIYDELVSVKNAGDVNKDGIDDIILGAVGNKNITGQSYVIFGNKASWPPAINLQDINGNNGFNIISINPEDVSGYSVSGAGDVNGDDVDDVIIGAPGANNQRGQSYVVFGHKGPWPVNISLYMLDGTNGFTLNGINPNDWSGWSVSRAGDVNGDGIADIFIGAVQANNYTGQSYIIFGEPE